MGLLDGVRRWWKRQFGNGEEADGGAETASDTGSSTQPTGAGYECAICGTSVEGPEATCPVCQSGDIVAADRDTSDGRSAPATTRQHIEDSDDETVNRLQQVHDSSEILAAHEDHWTEADGEFRVETPDGEVTVTSRIEVAALLEEHYK
ncbi:hypothetical protein HWV23_07800 [Natronomonas halophila]|uniref:hypothetical protein n=1 Tax=Natronomonas halophila TaxID=2747817 RepID=UPI0015B3B2A5|nr:hypothetical protein [Natronomonas halophila]QLD85632.1 hypothetical protein HWV23_07800 [Natronomonas halophila]